MPRYTVHSPLLHDGTRYDAGATVAMTEAQAKSLLERGTLTPAAESSPVEAMTVPELTEALEKLGVEIPKGAKKADLVALYEAAVKAGDEE